MKRFKHSLSHYVLSTFDMGELVPVGNFEVLPGDTVQMSTSALIRVSPLMTPVMHPVQVRIHHWFVPYRLLWDEWEDFITGGPDGEGAGTAVPQYSVAAAAAGTLLTYMGVPTTPHTSVTGISALPNYAYNKIWNEFYRDQDLQAEVPINNNTLLNCAWEKDYFTAARPWTQKGPEVVLPLGSTAPVKTQSAEVFTGAGQSAMKVRRAVSGALPGATGPIATGTIGVIGEGTPGGTLNNEGLYPTNLIADLANAVSPSVNDFRLAFALQRYKEARAQYGSRYTEYLAYLGVRSSDARLQRPEYLGGGRSTISFSEVLRTGNQTPGTDPPIGEMSGHGISAQRTRRFTRFFEEHGIVLSLASVRPRSMYVNGLHRKFLRSTKEDYWQRELEQIGQQSVYNAEVYAQHTTAAATFGYQDRYAEYRHHPSYVCGDFRTTLNDWHLGRIFASAPALNADFVKCVPSKRIHAEQTQDVLWGMFSHQIRARRMIGHRTIGRIF